jgi:hypothetical protein
MNDSLLIGARPSFSEGVARLLDFGCTLNEYNGAISGEQADYLALHHDWQLIGVDIANAVEREQQRIQPTQAK